MIHRDGDIYLGLEEPSVLFIFDTLDLGGFPSNLMRRSGGCLTADSIPRLVRNDSSYPLFTQSRLYVSLDTRRSTPRLPL